MSNYAVWNVRKRHEWLASPLKKKRVKRRQAIRVGLWDAWQRKKPAEAVDADASADAEPSAES